MPRRNESGDSSVAERAMGAHGASRPGICRNSGAINDATYSLPGVRTYDAVRSGYAPRCSLMK